MRFLTYIRERFPVVPVLLFAFGYAGLASGAWQNNNFINMWSMLKTICLFAFIFLFFLFRQRIVDEFKDSSHDLKNFPDRPVPRGLITKNALVYLGLATLFLEWFTVLLLGLNALLFYLPVFIYSLLMAKEFFISDWLNKHFNIYLLSHEVIFIFFGLFFATVISGDIGVVDTKFLTLGVLFAAPVSIEIVRKFSPRYDKKGKAVRDTYSTVWGRGVAITVLLLLALITGLLLTIIKDNYLPFLFSALISVAALVVGKKSDKVITIAGSVNFLGLTFLSNFLW